MLNDNGKNTTKELLATVQAYYGTVLKTSSDLKTSACCSIDQLPSYLSEILEQIHPEIRDKFYGCGSPLPPAITDMTVLDLGCGTGRDSYVLSKLVGKRGKVIGVDMTDQQLEVARKHLAYQADRFGYSSPNIEFHKGYIEDLAALHIADNSVDVVVSNCVINLSPQKELVFKEIFRVLKPGGELYFSDVFADRRIPESLRADPVLHGECLAGAIYKEDFRRLLLKLGCADSRIVKSSPIAISNQEIAEKISFVNFTSLTVRAFKIEIEDKCEDFGQVAYYLGTIANHPHSFVLDDHHTFFTGKPMLVCGNTAAMVSQTRFAKHFRVEGDTKTHFGLFDCASGGEAASSSACC